MGYRRHIRPYVLPALKCGLVCGGQHRCTGVCFERDARPQRHCRSWPARICSAEISSSRRSAASNTGSSSYDMRKIDLSKYPVPLHRIFFTQKL